MFFKNLVLKSSNSNVISHLVHPILMALAIGSALHDIISMDSVFVHGSTAWVQRQLFRRCCTYSLGPWIRIR